MSQHTKGPWNIHPAYPIDSSPMSVIDGDWEFWEGEIACGNRLIARASYMSEHPDAGFPRVNNLEEARANARLIAAAPELLEALEMVRDADEDSIKDGLPRLCTSAVRSTIDAAIAKATGGAQ